MFRCLRCALWGEPFNEDVTSKEFLQLMQLAEEQTVAGLVFDVLSQQRIGVGQQLLMESIGRSMAIERQNRKVNKEVEEMAIAFDSAGLDYIMVKGQTIGCLYPKPLLRQAGDIDFLVRDAYSKAKPMTEKALGVELPAKMLEMEVGFDRNGVAYELHTCLRSFVSRKHQRCWDALMEKEWQQHHFVEIAGQQVRVLSPTVLVAYVFIHLFFHFIREGVSLRQLCDWCVVLHHYRYDIDWLEHARIIDELGLTRGFKAFGVIAIEELGLPKEVFPVELKDDDRRWKEKLLADIFDGGNFGKLRHKATSSWRYKAETMSVAVRNSFRYRKLAPVEVGLMILRLLRGNAIVLMKRLF
ncbi:MAG: nucleotidyltransferase family protein [Prevotella sp.]|nr:nucleotidyltransferase family protein [Prevotella sp.]